MDRIWQWAWDRYAARYSWAIYAVTFALCCRSTSSFRLSLSLSRTPVSYVEAAAVTVAAVLVLVYVMVLPGLGRIRLVERWAAGHEVDRARALEATYTWARGAVARAVGANAVWAALLSVVVGVIAGASGSRLVQYGILGAVMGTAVHADQCA